jgi:hypothetical protein
MSTDTILAIAGLTVSAIGIPAAYFFARRSRQRPRIESAVDFDLLLDPARRINVGGVITYAGRRVTRLSRSIVAIWNERGDTVRRADIVDDDPLRIALAPDDQILQARLLFVSRPQCEIDLLLDATQSSVGIQFDFLDEGDGALLELIHEGTDAPDIVGTIRGATVRPRARSTNLTPSHISWMRESTRRTRMSRRAYRLVRPRRRLFAFALNVGMSITFIVLGLVFILHRHTARLVHPNRYDLSTLSGQHRFAQAVSAHGIEKSDWPNVIILVFGFSLLGMIAWSGLGRSAIPRSLLAHKIPQADDPTHKPAQLDAD